MLKSQQQLNVINLPGMAPQKKNKFQEGTPLNTQQDEEF